MTLLYLLLLLAPQKYRVTDSNPVQRARISAPAAPRPARYLSRLFVPLRDNPITKPLVDNPIREAETDDDMFFGAAPPAIDPFLRPDPDKEKVPAGLVLGKERVIEIDGSRRAAGVVRNERKTPVSLSVSINLFDAAGQLVRSDIEVIRDLAPGGTWSFSALMAPDEVSFKVIRVEVK